MGNVNWIIVQPISNIPIKSSKAGLSKSERRKRNRAMRQAVEDREANEKFYKDNKKFVHLANEEMYIAIHRNGKGIVISASDTKKERRRYLKSLDETIRQGAYVPVEKLEEFREEPEDYVI